MARKIRKEGKFPGKVCKIGKSSVFRTAIVQYFAVLLSTFKGIASLTLC